MMTASVPVLARTWAIQPLISSHIGCPCNHDCELACQTGGPPARKRTPMHTHSKQRSGVKHKSRLGVVKGLSEGPWWEPGDDGSFLGAPESSKPQVLPPVWPAVPPVASAVQQAAHESALRRHKQVSVQACTCMRACACVCVHLCLRVPMHVHARACAYVGTRTRVCE